VSVLVLLVIGLWLGIYVLSVSRYFYSDGQLATATSEEILQSAPSAKENHALVQNTPIVVAHVVSLIKCSKQERVTGFLDAAAVLRHSLHKNSVHSGNSKYSYKMYAIVHSDCKEHVHSLDRLGYTALVKPSPVKVEDIAEGYLKGHVEMENCCGSAEFIK
jgi:hypothetical protein